MPDNMPSLPSNCPSSGWPGLQDNEPEGEDIGLHEILATLSTSKRLIAGAAMAGGIIAAVVAFLLPNVYTATAIIMPPQKEQSSATALLGQIGPLAAVAGGDLGLKSPSDLYVGLLGSRTIADSVIERFGLKSVYRAKTATDTRANLRARSRFSAGKDSLIHIDVDDLNPQRAAAIANGFVDELNSRNKTFAITDAGQRRAFLEKKLSEEKLALSEAEDAMKTLQSKTGLIQLDGQTSVMIGSAAQLRAQIAAGEVALTRLKSGATSENPEVVREEAELSAMREQLRRLERSSSLDGPLVPISSIPQAGLDYVRRVRDLKYHEFLFELLSKQYEAARIDENKAAPALQVVDAAVPPDKKSGPHRGIIIVSAFFGMAAAASLFAFLRRSFAPPPVALRAAAKSV